MIGRRLQPIITRPLNIAVFDRVGRPDPWIEKLLQTPIEDYCEHPRDLILIPYLVIPRRKTDMGQIQQIVIRWAIKCAELRMMDPSRREFEKRTLIRVYEVLRDRIPHTTLDTLKKKIPELHKQLIRTTAGGD